MRIIDVLRGSNINSGLDLWRKTPGAVLLDVRTVEEYGQGHIPGSISIPLSELSRIPEYVSKTDTPLFVYCLSGARSSQAVQTLHSIGYSAVKSIGDISSYREKVEV